ncbi:MAG: pyridoxal-phosphate dependent enzyme [Candidatus Eremiobacteraeota bacterium]|nr:pyridoxal-phosphate dependent enzyme [Candidatus Eremiobacteraeota bacterium]
MNVAQLGLLPARILRRHDVPIVAVSEALLFEGMALHHAADGLVVEPAGAAPLAALLGYASRFHGKTVALVVSGANVDAALFDRVVGRSAKAS